MKKQRQVRSEPFRARAARLTLASRVRWHVRGGVVGFGLAGALLAGEQSLAQTPADVPVRLTVRPREMATGTQNPAAGEYHLAASEDPRDSLERYVVYVPQLCVGPHRCPLLVYMQPMKTSASEVLKWQRPVADKYGIIVLVKDGTTWPWEKEEALAALMIAGQTLEESVAAFKKAGLTTGGSAPAGKKAGPTAEQVALLKAGLTAEQVKVFDTYRYPYEPARRHLDAALKQVLQKFAIEPAKIAVFGFCAGGPATVFFGGANQDVFSRIILKDPSSVDSAFLANNVEPSKPTQTTEFLLEGVVDEAAAALQRAGHRVKVMHALRGHGHQVEDDDFTGRWLQESWTTPDPAARTAPRVIDPLPVLTTQALTQLRTFWEGFWNGCRDVDCGVITRDQRMALLRETIMLVGDERPSTLIMDMPAVAARYPAVAALLKKAGLTAQQHDAYRLALLSARATQPRRRALLQPTSIQGKNRAFVEAHPDEVLALETISMFSTP